MPDYEVYALVLEEVELETDWKGSVDWIQENKNPQLLISMRLLSWKRGEELAQTSLPLFSRGRGAPSDRKICLPAQG